MTTTQKETTMTTLTNDFHATEYRTRLTLDQIEDRLNTHRAYGLRAHESVRRLVFRIRAELCGVDGCQCAGDDLGRRGPQPDQ
jgi:hypothetical protein